MTRFLVAVVVTATVAGAAWVAIALGRSIYESWMSDDADTIDGDHPDENGSAS